MYNTAREEGWAQIRGGVGLQEESRALLVCLWRLGGGAGVRGGVFRPAFLLRYPDCLPRRWGSEQATGSGSL